MGFRKYFIEDLEKSTLNYRTRRRRVLILFYQHGVVICQPAKIGSEAAAAEAAAAVAASNDD